jgi:hypothetical protein
VAATTTSATDALGVGTGASIGEDPPDGEAAAADADVEDSGGAAVVVVIAARDDAPGSRPIPI